MTQLAMKLLLLSPLLFSLAVAQDDAATTITLPPSIPSDEPSYSEFESFTSDILNSTNTYRSQHNASDLSWNSTLEDFAQDYLDDMDEDDCEFEHSGGPFGENLAIGYQNATGAVEAWGDERDMYDFEDQGFDEETGHFTQLVWKNTTDVGCARKLCGERGWYVVCEYSPAGNVQDQYEEQVESNEEDEEDDAMMYRPGLGLVLAVAFVCVFLGA